MNISRTIYFQKIIPFINTPVVKVITGIRRCGKSVMLEQIAQYLLNSGVNENQILSLNFESFVDERVKSIDSVLAAVKDIRKACENKKIYLFFDEIQELTGWEKLINSFLIDYECDIYITGSNAYLLSGELATYLAGRYVEIRMYPFSFSESYEALQQINTGITKEQAFERYLKTGGYPFLYNYIFTGAQQKQYLEDIFNSIILKDITDRYKVRDIALLKSLISFFIENIGNNFSSSSLIKYLKNERRSVSTETIYNYLDYCKQSCLLHLTKTNDLVGKEQLLTQGKIYITDHGLREALFGNNQRDINQVLENIVYIELLRRGYTVTIGRMNSKEIDFIAERGSERFYYQVSYLLSQEETIRREFGAYSSISDNYSKYVLSLDKFDFSQKGIIHKNLIDWLLEG
ncbi:MAG: ATP-binding protein [Sphaerochaetaceae bacterium]|nr:ATP-binding protein [Sphaerochaetaceae bacterium]